MISLKSLPPKRMQRSFHAHHQHGFSLIEMAIVMVILGMLIGGMMMPLSSQREIQKRAETQRQLEDIRSAIIGFAQVNDRLPCPASAASNGVSTPNASGVCTAGNSFIPYATLGIRGSVLAGQLVDAWQQPIRYYLTSAYSSTPIALSGAAAGSFTICAVSAPAVCPAANTTASNVVAVVYSTGDSLSASPNPISPTNIYVQTPTATFDDIVVWIAQPELIYALSKTK